jgi:DNA-binding MarR family transcriptional regulator/GNAT superfamily N-acetyltransferase
MQSNYIERLGSIAIATRLKILTEKLLHDGTLVYRDMDSDFEPRWFAMLNLLNDRGALSITDIASELNQSHPAINQLSAILEEKGLVDSRKDKQDSRKRTLSLSNKGLEIIKKHETVWQAFREAIDELSQSFEPGFFSQIARLEKMLKERSMYSRVTEKLIRLDDTDKAVIVEYRPQYKEYFYALNKDWLEEYFTLEPYDELVLNHPEEEIIRSGGKVLFVLVGGKVAGTLALIKHDDATLELAKMAVEKNYRVKGYGRRLLQAAIRKSLCMGFDELILYTSRKLIAANSLYYSFGFLDTPMTEEEKNIYQRLSFKMKINLLTQINEQ